MSHGLDDPNATWAIRDLAIWSTVEITVGITCACMPSIRMLFTMMFSRTSGTTVDSSKADAFEFGGLSPHALAFGTYSRSTAQPRKAQVPLRLGEIHIERTYEIEEENIQQKKGSIHDDTTSVRMRDEATGSDERLGSSHDEAKLVPSKDANVE